MRRNSSFNWLWLLFASGIVAGAFWWNSSAAITHPPGIIAPEEPLQERIESPEQLRFRGYYLTPVADFSFEARVLGLKRYRNEPNARLAPFDLAVGWGPMSDSEILDQLRIAQTRRFYTWRYDGEPPLPVREIIRHSTNIHMIPSSPAIEGLIGRIKPGHVVRIEGRLVNVLSNDGDRWNTSTSRTDAGMGACEILWVEAVTIYSAPARMN